MPHEPAGGVQFLSGNRYSIFVPHFFGGVNTGTHPQLIDNTQCQSNASQARTQKGSLSNTFGQYTDDLNSNLTAVRTTFNGRYKTYAMEATAIYDALTDTAALLSGLTSNTAGGSFATIAGYDVMVNGTDMKKTVDGSTWTNLTAGATDAAPAGLLYVAGYNNRLFGCGHSDGKLRWSDVNDPTEWPPENEWDLILEDDETYTGLATWNGSLYAFAKTHIYVLQGFEVIRVVNSLPNTSCTSHRSIQSEPEFLAWWGREGLQMIRVGRAPYEPWRDKYGLIRDRDRSNDANVWSSWYPHERILSYYFADSAGDKVFLYFNPDSESFFTSLQVTGTSFVNEGGGTVRMTDDQLCHMAHGGAISGWLGGTLSESDLGANRWIVSKEFAPAGPGGECTVDTVSLLGSGSAVAGGDFLTCNLQLDGSGSNDIAQSSTWDTNGDESWVDFHFKAKCRSFAVRIEDSGKGNNQLFSMRVGGRIISG